jgi:signal transduction histidine kinase
MNNLLIAVDHRENALLLKGYLDQYHSIAVPTSVEQLDIPFDLGIFDGHALIKFWSQIQMRKQSDQPLFLPILLITPRQDINMITRQLWRSIDDIIFAPIEKAELFVRVEVLLRARQLSLDLKEKNLHLQTEITSHQETERSLRESDERFRAALENSPIVVARLDRDLRYTWVYNQPLFQASDILGKQDNEILGLGNTQALTDLNRSVLETGIGRREEIEIDIFETYTVYDITVEPIIENGRVEGLRVASVDITDRKRAEQRVTRLYDLVLRLSKSLTLEQVAKSIIQYGITALGATDGTVVLINDDQETLRVIEALGNTEPLIEAWQNFLIALSTAPYGTAAKTEIPFLYGSMEDHLLSRLFEPDMPPDNSHRAWALLPFSIEDKVIGGLGLSFPLLKIFDDAERAFMLTLAQQCAQALERVGLIEKLQQAAVLTERHRLARDLHDSVSQALFASTAMADSIPLMWDKKPEKARELLKQVTTLNRGALAEMRTLLFELRPEALIKTNLKALLIQLLDAVKARKTIETMLTVTGEPISLLEDVHLAFYRIAQESLNNVIKHSQATQAHIILSYHPDQITLQIIDNGTGFDSNHSTRGLGLGGMHERAELAHIALQIQSTQEGTCVDVSWITST